MLLMDSSTGRLKNSNGGAFDVDANLNRVTFIRGGSKFPLDFALDVEKEAQEDRPQTELEQRFIDAIKPLPSFNHSLVSLNTQNKIGDDIGFQLEPTPRNDNTLAEPAPVFGARCES